MAYFNDPHCKLFVLYGINDSVSALSDAVSLLAGGLLKALISGQGYFEGLSLV
jgi:myo-inositol catabolism protein IolC